MIAALRVLLTTLAAIVYSTGIGFLVAGLSWQTFSRWAPSNAVIAVGTVLAIRVATLFASMTSAATLNWKAIWIGGFVGVAGLVAAWPSTVDLGADHPPPVLIIPPLLASLVVAATARTLRAATTAHFYHSARFARALHTVQGFILFGAALPASLFWTWTRPYVASVTCSAFLLWRLWGGACPVTLAENQARSREGLPIMPPDSGFVPDVLARFGIVVSGNAVARFLYGVGFSLCGWFGLSWLF